MILCYTVEIKTDEYKHRLYGNLQWALKTHQHPESQWTLWWFGSDISRIGSGMCTPGPQLVLLSFVTDLGMLGMSVEEVPTIHIALPLLPVHFLQCVLESENVISQLPAGVAAATPLSPLQMLSRVTTEQLIQIF